MSSNTESPVDTGHEYDGIREHDNLLPAWWLMTLWGAMVFAVAYWLAYETFHVLPSPREAFNTEWSEHVRAEQAKEAAAAAANVDVYAALATDAAAAERGRAIYTASCLPCHADKGQGLVGPNLTDNMWIHGSSTSDIIKTVSDGFVAKGMPAWKPVLGPEKVKDVVAFVLTLKNTNVPGGKAPEGTAAP